LKIFDKSLISNFLRAKMRYNFLFFFIIILITGCTSDEDLFDDDDDLFNHKESKEEKLYRISTLMHDLAKKGNLCELELLMSGKPLGSKNDYYFLELSETRELFKKDKSIINKLDSDGFNPLHYAAIKGHDHIADLLLKNGAKNDITDESSLNFRSGSAIHLAALEGRNNVIEVLLKHGVNVNSSYADYGQTPLHFAVRGGHLDTVKILIAKGAEINALDGDGHPPIRYARKIYIYDYLKKNGALNTYEARLKAAGLTAEDKKKPPVRAAD
jgi:ankyrin repeat protein